MKQLWIVLFYFFTKICSCERRLANSTVTFKEKRFMAYLVSSSISEPKYDSWLCGGAIVSPSQILTSAACLTSVSHVYAIAGYRKYVNGRAVDLDRCTSRMKRRVISYFVPRNYTLSETVDTWALLDIGIAVIENSFDFENQGWKIYCDWIPKAIRISYADFQVGTDVTAFGWGGSIWRAPKDVRDLNNEYLHEIYSLIADKGLCKRQNNINIALLKWIYCVAGTGNTDTDGNPFDVGLANRSSWLDEQAWDNRRRRGRREEKGRRDLYGSTAAVHQKGSTDYNKDIVANHSKEVNTTDLPKSRKKSVNYLKNPAICIGDHGGPLVTWEGSEMVLIGVAVSAMIDSITHRCIQPSMFISTHCTGVVIDCLLGASTAALRNCEYLLYMDGTVINETKVDWSLDLTLL